MRSIVLTGLLLFSVDAISSPNTCDNLDKRVRKEFNVGSEASIHSVILSSKEDYAKLKKIIDETPGHQQDIDTALNDLNDENYVTSDFTKYTQLHSCMFSDYFSMLPLFMYVEKNKDDKELVADFEAFILPRLRDVRNPAFLNILLNISNAKRLAEIKYGVDGELTKKIENLAADAKIRQRDAQKETSKLINEENEKKGYSKKQLQEGVDLLRKEIAVAKEYSSKYLELVSQFK